MPMPINDSTIPKKARRTGVSMTASALWKMIRRTVSNTSQYLKGVGAACAQGGDSK